MKRDESKAALRRRLRAVRAEMAVDARAAAHRAMARYLERLMVARGGVEPRDRAEQADRTDRADRADRADRILGLYAATLGEADPSGACACLPDGWLTAWPRVAGEALELVPCQERELVTGYRGIREPPGDRAAGRLEEVGLLVVPGLAFDPYGHRLGQGGGHYDRLLARLRALAPRALVVGLAYAAQIVAQIPTEGHDQRVDLVVTEHGITGGA